MTQLLAEDWPYLLAGSSLLALSYLMTRALEAAERRPSLATLLDLDDEEGQ